MDSDTSSLSDTSGSDTTEYDTTDTGHIQLRIDSIMRDLRILLHKQHISYETILIKTNKLQWKHQYIDNLIKIKQISRF